MTLESTLANTSTWAVRPAALALDGEALTVEAGAGTDIFTNPLTGEVRDDAARALLDPPPGDWQFSARVRVDFRAPWDAGALIVWAGPDLWAKLNFELSPDGQPTLYSVVTRTTRWGGPLTAVRYGCASAASTAPSPSTCRSTVIPGVWRASSPSLVSQASASGSGSGSSRPWGRAASSASTEWR